MKPKPSREFRITDVPKGQSADADIHTPILNNKRAEFTSDAMAVDAALRLGISVEDAMEALED